MYDSGSPRRGSFGTKSQGGNGAPRLGIYQPPPPFFGLWTRDSIGMEKKKTEKGQRAITSKIERSLFTNN